MKPGYRTIPVVLLAGLFGAASFLFCRESASAPAADEARPEAKQQPVFGIEQRVPWTTSKITGSLEPPHPYKVQRAFPKLQFTNPVGLVTAPGSDRLFLFEVKGKIFSFPNRDDADRPQLMADLSQLGTVFRRMYGMAFHPQFAENRHVYLCYVGQQGTPGGTRVSRFEVQPTDPPTIDLSTETIIIQWFGGGHNGGCLKFGPRDGYLYISTGDGSSPSPPDQQKTGQDNSDLLAAMLRIDVDHPADGMAYGIPADNPFVNQQGTRPEVWAYGFRNPWRMSFDNQTGYLWVGDVGWEMFEMIYRVERGGNYGWSIMEGPQPVRPGVTEGPTPILPAVAAHSHIESRSITGGAVYGGKRLPELGGAYVYGDYVTGILWALRYDGRQMTWQQELADTSLAIVAFGESPDGELYVLDYAGGIYRLAVGTAAKANADFPRKLSDTGLFSSVADFEPAPGVIPYSVNAAPWADGATAERLLAVPGAPKLDVWTTQNVQVGNVRGNWKFPADTVFAKTLSLEIELGNPRSRRRIETQILHYDQDTWRAYSYLWNDEQTDALLVPAEGTEQKLEIRDPAAPGQTRQQTWRVASRGECIVCHTTRGGSIYGFIPPQLEKQHTYGDVAADQLATLVHIGLFDDPATIEKKNPEHAAGAFADPYDESVPLPQRARSYLHVNCAQCHRRGGGGTARFELQYHLTPERMGLIGERPTQGAFKILAAENVAPGDPYRSVLYYRLAKLGRGHMPKIGGQVIDRRGLKLMHDWIAQLEPPVVGDVQQQEAADRLRAGQRQALAKLIAESDAGSAIDRLLSTTSGALLLVSAIDDGRLSATIRKQVVAAASAHPAGEVRGLYERFLPEQQRTKRLGSVVQADELLALAGNAERGRALFLDTSGVQCKNCHQIDGRGKQVGPDLSKIGKKYSRAELLETILDPSKKIDKEFAAYVVETTAGRVHVGLLVKQNESLIVLKTGEGKLIEIPAGEVEVMAAQRKSLMPDLLLREMTAQQVADLLAYLAELK